MDNQQPNQNLSTSSSAQEPSSSFLPVVDESLLLSNVLDQELGNCPGIETILNDLMQSVETHLSTSALVMNDPNNNDVFHQSTISGDIEQQYQLDSMNLHQFVSLGNDDLDMVLESLDSCSTTTTVSCASTSRYENNHLLQSSSLPSTSSQSNSFLLTSSSSIKLHHSNNTTVSINDDVMQNSNKNNNTNNNDNLVTSTSSPHHSTILSPSSTSQTSSSKFNSTNFGSSSSSNSGEDDDYEKGQGGSSEQFRRKRKRIKSSVSKREVGLIKKSRGKLIYEQIMSPEPKKSKSTKRKYQKKDSKKKKDNNSNKTATLSTRNKLAKSDSERIKSKNFRFSISHSNPATKSLLEPTSEKKVDDYIQCELEHKNQTVFQRIVKGKDGRFNIMERKRNPNKFIQPGFPIIDRPINEFTYDKNEADQLRKEEEEIQRLSQAPHASRVLQSLHIPTATNTDSKNNNNNHHHHNTFSFHDDDNGISSKSGSSSNQNSNRDKSSHSNMNTKKIVLVDYQISDEEIDKEEMIEETSTTIEQQINIIQNREDIETISNGSNSIDGEKSPTNNNNTINSSQPLTTALDNSPTTSSSSSGSDLRFVVHFPAPAIVKMDLVSCSSNDSDDFDMTNIRIDTSTTTDTATTTTTNIDCQFIDKVALRRALNIPNDVFTNPLNTNLHNESTKHSDNDNDDDIRIISPVPPEVKEVEVINLCSDSENENGGESFSQRSQNQKDESTKPSDDDDISIISPVRPEVKEVEVINLSSDSEIEHGSNSFSQRMEVHEVKYNKVASRRCIRRKIKSELQPGRKILRRQ